VHLILGGAEALTITLDVRLSETGICVAAWAVTESFKISLPNNPIAIAPKADLFKKSALETPFELSLFLVFLKIFKVFTSLMKIFVRIML